MTLIEGGPPRRRGRPRKESHPLDAPRDEPARVPDQHDELLTTAEAAALTKLSKVWFHRKRAEGKGPPFRKRGRIVRYLKSELLAWFTEFRQSDFRGDS